MSLLFRDAKERRPFRFGLTYTGLAVVFLLAADLTLPAIGAPPWALRLMVATLFTAFPFILVLVWALSAGPLDGHKAPQRPWEQHG